MGIKVGGHMNDDNKQDDINQVPASSPDFKTELAKKLQELAPEVIADGKVDTKKLKELLDEDTTDDSERFGLFWPGKKRAMRAAQEPTTATLKPAKEESKDWDTTQNIFIEGDNLEVLKILQKHYHNKIKMIYIDPPYNTGQDFVYPDNYREGLASYLEFTKQVNEEGKKVSTNSDTDGRYHSNWLNMMYPRLKLARNLLDDDGVIFISIDYNENYHLRQICDEIFGDNNFIGEIYWESKTKSQNTETSYNKLQPKAEMILVYGRRPKRRFNLVTKGKKDYPHEDDKGKYREYPLEVMNATGIRGRQSMIYEVQGILPPQGKQWQLGHDQVSMYESSGNLFIRDGRVIIKMRPGEERDETTDPFWGFFPKDMGTAESAKKELKELVGDHDFETVKPVEVIKRLILHATSDNDIILDFFAGSGTTAQAVMQLNSEQSINRKWITAQLPEATEVNSILNKRGFKTVSSFTRYRLEKAAEKIANEKEPSVDTGYRVYKLADTNFSKWQTSSDVDVDAVQQRFLDMRDSSNDDASQEDLLTEILVKLGLPLTVKVTEDKLEGLRVWNVSDKAVVAYLDEHTKPSLDQLRTITDTNPGKIVILEDSFQGDDELKTNLSQICKSNDIELWTV